MGKSTNDDPDHAHRGGDHGSTRAGLNRDDVVEVCPIPRLLSMLRGMGVEIRVLDGRLEVCFMSPLKIFDRDPMTDETRIARIRSSRTFCELLGREAEVVEHWRGSPGAALVNYPDEQRFLTHQFQDLLIQDYRKRGLVRRVEPNSDRWRWVGGWYQ